ncbi:MAG: bifunctional 5,10-methylenetetrahydrofolate dehydrogenase/5,10-methenyltetrahydrofolate cyclohydrolase [Candidatus Micrarchaeota archaeon]|nr:bifunctional 5,10-methylenetetrahydrofolate dehydrogenase/5,10-methenyltetrahydrofolate cyclohydrolase [Candidatus Micrarchaeota archaeon]
MTGKQNNDKTKSLVLSSKELYNKGLNELKSLINEKEIEPRLDIIFIGNNKESEVYVNHKVIAGKKIGIDVIIHRFDEDAKQKEVVDSIKEINQMNENHGIIVQLPVPKTLNQFELINLIDPKKDVDGISSTNLGLLVQDKPYHYPCTPKGVVDLLKHYNVALEGANVCVINRSIIVGKPLLHMLLNENASVTLCHSKTKNLKEITNKSDIVVCAIGKPKFFNRSYFNKDTIVIDVGINRIDNEICGDVDFDDVMNHVKGITPVPGGIGKLTVLNLLKNTVSACMMLN